MYLSEPLKMFPPAKIFLLPLQCGGVDMLMIEHFQTQGITTYDKIPAALRERGAALEFESPKRRYSIVGT
jgi:hypothetical protein